MTCDRKIGPYDCCSVVQGDCLELMRELPDGCVDAVVTSPPYDELRDYNGYSFDFPEVALELRNVIKVGGVIVWIVNDETKDGDETGTSFKQALRFKELGLRLHDTMIWNKGCFTGVGSVQCRYGPSAEFMFVFSKGKPSTFNPICDRKNIHAGALGKARSTRLPSGDLIVKTHEAKALGEFGIRFNVWNIAPEMSNTERAHPAQFPVDLAADHIVSWSNEGDLVIDPFCGSGTTLVAAKKLTRHFLGFEISAEYCQIARDRLARIEAQPNLFEPKPEQLKLENR